MALRSPKKQHHGTFNPHPSGVFTRYESRVIVNLFLLKTRVAQLGMCVDAGTGISLTSSREPGGKDDSKLVVDKLESPKAMLSKADRVDYVVVEDRALGRQAFLHR